MLNGGVTRREFLQVAVGAAAVDPFRGGMLAGTRPLFGRAAEIPLDTLLGAGLDARMFTDLSTLTPSSLVTPTECFYIRTARPDLMDLSRPWTITIAGADPQVAPDVTLNRLARLARPIGTHLLECAGNNNPRNFGLMSTAEWTGVPIFEALEPAAFRRRDRRILVSGFDRHSQPSRTSTPGAAWIFSADDLERAGAFLATGMNGAPLPPDHGAPVRLVIPNWYGCACIKWVDRIELVDDDAPATSQMQEFAARTFQRGRPALAREYEPAVMDHAAMPIRVEKWVVAGRVLYKVVGILWGGRTPTNALAIRFRNGDPYERVDACPVPKSTTTWTLWSHAWRPRSRGRYDIVLKINDRNITTQRLDVYYYARSVDIDEV
jgi:DMSO/TMAO reductase YedYZ molybdopterin-dependent catalytic subunit